MLHGVSRLDYAGLGDDGYAQFPDWTMAEQKSSLLHDLRVLCHTAQRRYPLEGDDLLPWVGRFRLQLIGGIVNPPSHPVHMKRYETPMPSMELDWKDCNFRLTLAWKNERVLKDEPEIEMIEVAGPAMSGPPHAETGCKLCFGCTLFFSGPKEGESVEKDTGLDFVNVDGSSIRKPPSEDNVTKFSSADLKDLGRKTGIPFGELSQALGNIASWRIHNGLLQRLVFSKASGVQEWMTCVPDGDWRSFEWNGVKRRITLRRYILIMFHCTPVGPHKGRTRTAESIQEAGLWWDGLVKEVTNFVRHCLVCASEKEHPLITGHQRIRDYDGPFRFLMIDFVGL